MQHAERRNRLRELLQQRNLDALLVNAASSRYYLSGFELHDVQLNESAGFLVVTRQGRDYLCTDPRYEEAAQRLWKGDDVVVYKDGPAKAAAKLLKSCGTRLGFDPEAVSWAFGAELARELSLLPCRGLVERLRRIKDEAEVACLRRSFALNHALLEWIPSQLKEGMTEAEASWLVERYFREHGASELAFPSIVAFGPNGALPHAVPGAAKLAPEMPVLFDVGCRVDGYCSDQTRSFWFGEKPSPEFERAKALVAEAQAEAIKILAPGLPMCDAYHAANAVFERAGCARHFTHSLGHGVGLDTHEEPSLHPRKSAPLEAGMTVTVEPGLYYPGLFGVRLEYTTLIVAGGAEVL